ncbi:MAG: DUF2871 domain-containing protein [Micrococcales bacterium]|nr:DUF2871 domain-containing protein [Micrococcales bacterium]
MLSRIYWSAATWTGIGMVSGLYYRELTRARAFDGRTQLAVVHTHTLVLGTVMLLAVLALAVSRLLAERDLGRFLLVWNIGLALTAGGLLVKGTLQVLGSAIADSPAIAGVSGLGHMTLSGALVLLFMALRPLVRADQTAGETARPESVSA